MQLSEYSLYFVQKTTINFTILSYTDYSTRFQYIINLLLQLWYQHKQVRDSRHHLSHELSDAYKPQDGVLGDMDVAEINLADMNPEEIRVCPQF